LWIADRRARHESLPFIAPNRHWEIWRREGDLSKFIEDAVKWRVLDQTLAEARKKFADLAPDALESLMDEAVTATRQAGDAEAG
jgi:hypothetical protein